MENDDNEFTAIINAADQFQTLAESSLYLIAGFVIFGADGAIEVRSRTSQEEMFEAIKALARSLEDE